MARSEARVLVVVCPGIFKNIDMLYPLIVSFLHGTCLWEEMCFLIFSSQSTNILFQHRRMESPGKIFPGNFLLWRIPGGFEHGTVVLPVSKAKGSFVFFPHKSLDCGFWRKRWMRPFFLKFSLDDDQFWHPCGFNYKLMITLPLSSSNGKKTTHRKDLKLFITMLNKFWRISTPTKTITQPTHWFLGGSSAARCCGEETFGVKKRQSWRDTKLGTEVAGGRTWWMA